MPARSGAISNGPLVLGSFIALTATGNAEQALTFLDRALLTEPRNALAHNNRAVALAFLGRIEESRKAWTRSAELTPRSATHPVLNATRANQISPGRQNLRFAGVPSSCRTCSGGRRQVGTSDDYLAHASRRGKFRTPRCSETIAEAQISIVRSAHTGTGRYATSS